VLRLLESRIVYPRKTMEFKKPNMRITFFGNSITKITNYVSEAKSQKRITLTKTK